MAKRAAIVVTSKKLEVAVVRAFVFGSAELQLIQLFNQNVTKSDQTSVYQQLVIGNLNELKDKYQREKTSLDTTITKVAAQRVRAQHATYEMKTLLESNIELQDQTQATLATVTAEYKSEIINYEISAGVAAARDHNTAGEEQAITAASAVGGQSAANQVIEAEQQAIATPTIAEIAGADGSGSQGRKGGRITDWSALRWAERPRTWASTARAWSSGPGLKRGSPFLAPPRLSGPTWSTFRSRNYSPATSSTTTTSMATTRWTTW